jgi:hypothetical protein
VPCRLILDAVVQKRRNGEVLVAAVFENSRSDGQEMGNVGRRGPFADLSSMYMGGIKKSAVEPIS